MATKFAFVRYLKDNEKEVVPLTFFKNFCPTDCGDFEPTKAYLVKWHGDAEEDVHYKAQVLMLGASKEELQEKKNASRVRIRKVLDTSVEESSSSEDEEETLQKETAKCRKDRRRDQDMAKKKSLKAIMTENLVKRKLIPLFPAAMLKDQPTSQTSKIRACESQECLTKLKNAKKRRCDVEAHNVELEVENKQLKKTAMEYQNLNKELQVELLKTLRGKKQVIGSRKCSSLPRPLSEDREPVTISDEGECSYKGPTYVEEDGMISIGANICIGQEQWNALQCQTKHSLFVKGLAVATWGTEILKDRSLDGKVCPRFKDQRQARVPLTPEKVKAIKECFMDRLVKMSTSKEDQALEGAKFKKYLTEKIQDINRLLRKQMNH